MRCSSRPVRTLAVTALVPVALLTAGPTASAAPAPATADVQAGETQKAQLLAAINAERAAAGLPALRLDAAAVDSARQWAAHLARTGTLAHHPDLEASLVGQGATTWTLAGENVGVGPHVAQIHPAFMASPTHRANVLRPEFSEVGIGATEAADGQVWVAVHFLGG